MIGTARAYLPYSLKFGASTLTQICDLVVKKIRVKISHVLVFEIMLGWGNQFHSQNENFAVGFSLVGC